MQNYRDGNRWDLAFQSKKYEIQRIRISGPLNQRKQLYLLDQKHK
jgi:hypothetical protein